MSVLIIDVASDPTPRLAQLYAYGVRTIFGYLSSINPHGEKCWTLARVKEADLRGFRIGLVHEGYGGVKGIGLSPADGVRDGRYCRTAAAVLGAPKGTCVYFACDTDLTMAGVRDKAIPYFRAVNEAFSDGHFRVGVYGSGLVCETLKNLKMVDLTWEAQSKGWASYKAWLAQASIVQGADTHIAHLDVDTDVAVLKDIGDFIPTFSKRYIAPPPPPPEPTPEPVPPKPAPSVWDHIKDWLVGDSE